jgi:GPH family glycoside/pentoside/hexuronide:cation symporter
MGLIPALLVMLGLVVMRRWPERGPHPESLTASLP